MSRRNPVRLLLAGVAAALLAATALPSAASAACGVTTPLVGWQLSVRLSHGYCLTATPIDALPAGSAPPLIVQVTSGTLDTGLTRVEYRLRSASWGDQWKTPALARTGNWMSLGLGAEGTIAVTFHAGRLVALPPAGGCAGKPGRELLGTWRGTIRFTGQHRYAAVNARATPGAVILKQPVSTDPSCGQTSTVGAADIPGPFDANTVTLESDLKGPVTLFQAIAADGLPTVEFKAYTNGACSVERLDQASTIAFTGLDWNSSTPPSAATLTPGAPFRGSGQYSGGVLRGSIAFYCPDQGSWVPLPAAVPASWSFFP